MIREAELSDIGRLLPLAENVAARYPDLQFDGKSVTRGLRQAISGPNNFIWVSEHAGGITGALIVFVGETLWFERQVASVALFHTEVPGDGVALLRKLVHWVKGRRGIKHIEMNIWSKADPRLDVLLSRLGFRNTEAVYRWFREGTGI